MRLDWQERDGPVPVTPAVPGLGMRLIRGLVESQLRGSVVIQTAHHERPDAVRIVDGDIGIEVRRNELTEGEREIGDRQPRTAVPHERSEKQLDEHQAGAGRRQSSQPPLGGD